MKKNNKNKTRVVEDTSHLLGNHLKVIESNYSRTFVYIEKELKNFLYFYDSMSNKWYYEVI
jgi:hypothetical protein